MNERVKPPGGWVDSFLNLLTGIGLTGRDRVLSQSYTVNTLDQSQLENAYRGDWIARKIIDIPAQDSTRAWRSWQADDAEIEAIEKVEKDNLIQQKMQTVLKKARLYGGAALVIGVNQGGEDKPIELDSVVKDSLKFVHVVTKNEITQGGQIIGDLMSPWYGEPEYWTLNPRAIQSADFTQLKIHPSRVIKLVGAPYPDALNAPDVWGDSILQIVDDAIRAVGTISGSIAQMITDAKLDIISVPGLADITSTSAGEAKLTKRFAYANTHKSIINAIILDKEEAWQRIQIAFPGIPEVLQMYLLIASGAADIPVTRLLGQAPAGMNATGESDIRNYYDRLKSDQEVNLTPTLHYLDEVIIRSALGTRDEALHYNWNSLWQLDDTQKATLAKSKADTFKIDNDAAIIPVDIMRDARINQLIEDGTYPGLEGIVDDWELANGPMEEDPAQMAPPLGAIDPLTGLPMAPPPGAPGAKPGFPPKPGATKALPPGAKQKQLPPPKPPKTADASYRAERKRQRLQRIADARPLSLYVRRQIVNAQDIHTWAKAQGFKSMLPKDELHVTICYSKKAIDWTKIIDRPYDQDENGEMRIPPGGVRLLDRFGDATVLLFTSSSLTYRHCYIKQVADASYDYDDYQPHMTITYAPIAGLPDLETIEPYQGPIVLGPEIFEEIVDSYTPNVNEETVL